jgi:predicted carbohydrate-binding protein with CBM5 and CBM33 domain|tara:strand:+ start:316 stop:759 length:444 start_codon:yes stop_codon:yes gene_type:complete
MTNVIEKIFDNTKDGAPNYAIDLIDGTRLYYRGTVLNPMPKSGDAINFTVVNTKTSANGNQYTNIKDVQIADNHTTQGDNYDQSPQPVAQPMMNNSNLISKSDQARQDIFVTGVVGRSMGSGHFSVEDINDLTKNAVNAFNENLKGL